MTNLETAAIALGKARAQGYDIYYGTMDYAMIAARHGVTASALYDYMVTH